MTARRSLVRFWRRLRRPTFARLVCASLALHLVVGLAVMLWLSGSPGQLPLQSRAPLVVELPPAEPGSPLVRPEAPPAGPVKPAPPAPRAAAPRAPTPAPPSPAAKATPPPEPSPPAPATPPPPPAPAPAPAPVVPPPAPAPSAPPVVAKAPEPPPPPRPESGPEPSPPAAAPAPAPAPAAPPAASTPEPAPPAVAARPPEPGAGGRAPGRPSPVVPPTDSTDSLFGGQRFSLLTPRPLDVPPAPSPSGRGGTQREGTGAGESGTSADGQIAVPLNTTDPRYAAYFAELKRRIEEKWVYPQEAARNGQSGQGDLRFFVRKDGTVRTVEIVNSSGIRILDSYIENAIRLAAPFPPIPASVGEDLIPISINFTYTLQQGFHLFGFR